MVVGVIDVHNDAEALLPWGKPSLFAAVELEDRTVLLPRSDASDLIEIRALIEPQG